MVETSRTRRMIARRLLNRTLTPRARVAALLQAAERQCAETDQAIGLPISPRGTRQTVTEDDEA